AASGRARRRDSSASPGSMQQASAVVADAYQLLLLALELDAFRQTQHRGGRHVAHDQDLIGADDAAIGVDRAHVHDLLVGLVAGIRYDEHGNRRQAVGEDEVQAFRRIQLDLPAHAGGAPEAWQRIAEYPVALVDTTAVTGSDMMHVPVL